MMHRKRAVFLILTLLFLAAAAVLAWNMLLVSRNIDPSTLTDNDRVAIYIEKVRFSAEVAVSPQKKAQGLSGHVQLMPKNGMFFVFENPDRHIFWMKDMLLGLDFIWMRNGTVVNVAKNIPPPEPDQEPETLTPDSAVDAVLEIPAGSVEQFSISVGDRVYIKRL